MSLRFTRLHLATRIHFGLLRERGRGIDVGRMLRQRDYAGEVLHRCRRVASFALLDLADRFDDLSAADDARAHLERAAQRARAALAELTRRAAAAPSFGAPGSDARAAFGRGPDAADAARQRFAPEGWPVGAEPERRTSH